MSIFYEDNNNTEFDNHSMFLVDKEDAIKQDIEIAELKKENKYYKEICQMESRDPNGTIWEVAERLQKETSDLKGKLAEIVEDILNNKENRYDFSPCSCCRDFDQCDDGDYIYYETVEEYCYKIKAILEDCDE